MSLGLLGNVNIHEKLDIAYWMNVRLFNENVTKNRCPPLNPQLDVTMDVSAKSQMVVIFRYIKNGDPVERFWTYLEPQNLNAESLTADILRILDPILENSKDKLIAQCYDGAAVMSGRNTGVQARIKEKYNFAHFVHCYAHQLNLIMSQAVPQSSQVRTFFGNLQETPPFFKNSPQRVAVLNRIVGKRIPHGAPTRWNFNIRTVNVVFEHRESILECMEEIENSFHNQSVQVLYSFFHKKDTTRPKVYFLANIFPPNHATG
nr:unnamed protein product [Callosobruchus analis]